jgi:hypothetical protein
MTPRRQTGVRHGAGVLAWSPLCYALFFIAIRIRVQTTTYPFPSKIILIFSLLKLIPLAQVQQGEAHLADDPCGGGEEQQRALLQLLVRCLRGRRLHSPQNHEVKVSRRLLGGIESSISPVLTK